MPTDQFLQVTLYFGAPGLKRGFFTHFSHLSYDSSSGSNSVSYNRIRHFRIILQVQEIREANVRMILSALEQPNREVEQLIKEQKDKYYSKYIFLFFYNAKSSLTGQRKIHSWPLKTLFPLILNILYLSFPFTGCEPGDEDKPDLPALATLDFAALKDIRQTGIEYCRHYEALLHNTPGLQPGYLLEEESRYLVTGVSIFASVFSLYLHCIFLPCD